MKQVSVALLIDGENVNAPGLIEPILAEAAKLGTVTTRQLYGNWASPHMQSWKEIAAKNGLESMQNIPEKAGRNAADIALVIGAMDLLHTSRVQHFCLVLGDSDYTPLVDRLRKGGCTVVGIGGGASSQALKDACNAFIPTDKLHKPVAALPQPKSRKTTKVATPPLVSAKSKASSTKPIQPSKPEADPQLAKILVDVYNHCSEENGWVLLSAFGTTLKKLHPKFKASYYKGQLSTFLQKQTELIEMRVQPNSDGHKELRLRKQGKK